MPATVPADASAATRSITTPGPKPTSKTLSRDPISRSSVTQAPQSAFMRAMIMPPNFPSTPRAAEHVHQNASQNTHRTPPPPSDVSGVEQLRAPRGFCDQPIDDGGERFAAARSGGECAREHCELAMGAGAAGEDLARVRDLVDAIEMTGVLIDQHEDLFEQLRIWNDRAFAEIDEALIKPVALRPPAVLVDQHARIEPPALVLALQPPQHS